MADRREERLRALVAELDAAGLDGLLVTSLPNIRYLTGFSGSSALLVVSRREMLFVSDFRYEVQAAAEIGGIARIVIDRTSLWTGLWQHLPQIHGLELLGFESVHLVHRDFQRLLDAGSRWTWRPTLDLVERLRERKASEEIAAIATAAGMAERALGRLLPEIRAGMTELQIAGILERMLREEGSERFPFPSIVASGPQAALPHARSSARQVGRGEFVLIDFGAESGGYCSDITRTMVVGPPTDEQRAVYAVVRDANETAATGVRAGMPGRDADALAREYIERHGYADAFGHGLGHGLGLEVHEAPRLSRTAEGVLPEDAVVTIEPGIYLPGWGGIRIEDDVHLSADGPRALTRFTHELIEVG